MAEWFKRGTVNTFYRGSNPLKALKNKQQNKTTYKNILFINIYIKLK